MSVASLVLGIIAAAFGAFGGVVNWIGLIPGILGIIFAVVAKKKDPEDGKATAGLVCSIIGTALVVALWLACTACVGGAASLLG